MKQRSLVTIFLLSLVTLGIYCIYWLVSTKDEMVQRGAEIPSAWLLIVPFASIYWLWKYFQAAEQVTNGAISGVAMFIVHIFLGILVAGIVCQNKYNQLTSAQSPPPQPNQPTFNQPGN